MRTTLLVLLLLGVLGGGLWAGWQYTQGQYYVGATEQGQIAIFRGVPGQVAGLDLSSVSETSQVRLDDLTPVAQERVKEGIHAGNQDEARTTLTSLTTDDLKPICAIASFCPLLNTPVTVPSGPILNCCSVPLVKPSDSLTSKEFGPPKFVVPVRSMSTAEPSAKSVQVTPSVDDCQWIEGFAAARLSAAALRP